MSDSDELCHSYFHHSGNDDIDRRTQLVLVWVKAYISLFLIFAMLLYLLPSDVYRRYLRFFLEMILVLFCLTSVLGIGKGNYEQRWNQAFRGYYEEWERRKEEAESYSFLDENYVNAIVQGQEE